jgi:hypothetical protein
MRECAYARAFQSSQERATALPRWLHLYHMHRPHISAPDNRQSTDFP